MNGGGLGWGDIRRKRTTFDEQGIAAQEDLGPPLIEDRGAIEVLRPSSRQTVEEHCTQAVLVCLQIRQAPL